MQHGSHGLFRALFFTTITSGIGTLLRVTMKDCIDFCCRIVLGGTWVSPSIYFRDPDRQRVYAHVSGQNAVRIFLIEVGVGLAVWLHVLSRQPDDS